MEYHQLHYNIIKRTRKVLEIQNGGVGEIRTPVQNTHILVSTSLVRNKVS